MPNEFDFESPLNKLLSNVIPRFIEGQLQRESQERMALEEISFRESESRLDRLLRTEEADLSRKASAEQARLERVQAQQSIDQRRETFEFNRKRAIKRDRIDSDKLKMETFDGMSPRKILEASKHTTMQTPEYDQVLSDKRTIAQFDINRAKDFKALGSVLINPRERNLYITKLNYGDVDGALGILERAENKLAPDKQADYLIISESIKSLNDRRLPGDSEQNSEIDILIEQENQKLRDLFTVTKKPKDDLSLIEKKVINIMANASGISKDEFKKGGKGEALITKFAMEQGDADLSDSELIELAKIVSKKPKKTSLELFQESTREKINRKHAKKRKSDIESILELNRRAKDKGFSIDDIMMGF